jgi:hypothetical protein
MPKYRLYTLSETSQIISAVNCDFDGDACAIRAVIEMRRHIEVWCDRRIVSRIDKRGHVIPTSPSMFSPESELRE